MYCLRIIDTHTITFLDASISISNKEAAHTFSFKKIESAYVFRMARVLCPENVREKQYLQ